MNAIKPPTTKAPQKEGEKSPLSKRDYGILFPIYEFVNLKILKML
jgi:hypothetical protein